MKLRRTFLVGLMSAAVLGCVSNRMPPGDTRVTIAPDLCGDVEVSDVRCARGSSSYLTFQANLVNVRNKTLAVDCKVQWLDAEGVEIDSVVSTWNTRALQPFEIRGLKATAPRPDAADMRFYVRKAR